MVKELVNYAKQHKKGLAVAEDYLLGTKPNKKRQEAQKLVREVNYILYRVYLD